MKSTSYGIVILNEKGEVLLCHATETHHWDIPKGQADPGEMPVTAALRETEEETGLRFAPGSLTEIGLLPYRRDKDLHLFAVEVSSATVRIDACTCRSMFPRIRDGVLIPEMDAYRWVAPEQVALYASASLSRMFATALPLARVRALCRGESLPEDSAARAG